MSAPLPKAAFQDGAIVSNSPNGAVRLVCCPGCGSSFSVGRFYGVRWHPAEEATLREMFGRGKTYGQIGLKLNRSRNAVASKCRQLGLVRA